MACAPSVSTGVELAWFPAPGPAGGTGPAFTSPLFTWLLSLDPTAASVLQVGQELASYFRWETASVCPVIGDVNLELHPEGSPR